MHALGERSLTVSVIVYARRPLLELRQRPGARSRQQLRQSADLRVVAKYKERLIAGLREKATR